ncbi:MAG: DUF4157 domain-containing protein [Saprospiraceae bacterium]
MYSCPTVTRQTDQTAKAASLPFFQPKLTVNTPGDAHEQEADRVADQVMRMPDPGKAPAGKRDSAAPTVLRPALLHRKCADCGQEEKEKLQRKAAAGADASGKTAPAIVSGVLNSGGGQPMDTGTRQFMESRFGQDFGQVRIHTDSRAAESAAAIQAKAYTSGKDIVFGAGAYQPGNDAGKRLLAHELVHVGQQGGEGNMIQRFTNYKKAKRHNVSLAQPDQLGWGGKLEAVQNGSFKDWSKLWKEKKYDEFADKVAMYQVSIGLKGKEVDGILGLKTWGKIGGLGEAIAGIVKVNGEAENICTLASKFRMKRAHKMLGLKFELAEGKTWNTFNAILQSIPSRMLDIDEKYRGTGAAGALVYAGLGTFVEENEIWTGKLKPGAAIQVWNNEKDFDLLQKGRKKVGRTERRIRESDSRFDGTSLIFVRYDTKNNDRLRVRHFGVTEWKRKSSYKKWVAANVIA